MDNEQSALVTPITACRVCQGRLDWILNFGLMPLANRYLQSPAKFTMLGELLGWTPSRIAYVVEDSPIKVGRFTPGSHIPIVNRQHFIDHPTEHCIITAANYADMIVKANPQHKGRWILLQPTPHFL